MNNVIKILNNEEFESSSSLTPQFDAFSRVFKKEFTKFLKQYKTTKVVFSVSHFDITGFFGMPDNSIWYFSVGDVRWNKNNMLIRTAKDYNDFTGGSNCSISLKDFNSFKGEFERVVLSN